MNYYDFYHIYLDYNSNKVQLRLKLKNKKEKSYEVNHYKLKIENVSK